MQTVSHGQHEQPLLMRATCHVVVVPERGLGVALTTCARIEIHAAMLVST